MRLGEVVFPRRIRLGHLTSRFRGCATAGFKVNVRGQVQYVGSVKGWDNDVYVALARSLAQVHPTFERRVIAPVKRSLYVCTEGKTDIVHLATALKHFHDTGEFLDLVLGFDDNSAFEGDSALQKHLRQLPASTPSVGTVCLFDRDNEKLLREERLLQVDWVDRGNGVVAAALVIPSFRVRESRICIEMLYPDDVSGSRTWRGAASI